MNDKLRALCNRKLQKITPSTAAPDESWNWNGPCVSEFDYNELRNGCVELLDYTSELLATLQEIAEGRGRYSIDDPDVQKTWRR